MLFTMPNQQCQSTEGMLFCSSNKLICHCHHQMRDMDCSVAVSTVHFHKSLYNTSAHRQNGEQASIHRLKVWVHCPQPLCPWSSLVARIYDVALNFEVSNFGFSMLVRRQEEHPACKKLSHEVLAWLSVWSELQMICILSSWCHCHPIISCFIIILNGFVPFWCRLTQVVLEKRPLNECPSDMRLTDCCMYTVTIHTLAPCCLILLKKNVSEGIFILISANTLYGPMHTKSGVQEYVDALEEIKKQGGKIAFGGKVSSSYFGILQSNFVFWS